MSSASWRIERDFPPITRSTLAIYAGASGDLNGAHIDIDVARAAGFDDVFAQGMLVMAYMGRAITDVVPAHQLRHFSSRFVSITRLGDCLTCVGNAGETFDENGERRFAIDLEIKDRAGDVKLVGRVICAAD